MSMRSYWTACSGGELALLECIEIELAGTHVSIVCTHAIGEGLCLGLTSTWYLWICTCTSASCSTNIVRVTTGKHRVHSSVGKSTSSAQCSTCKPPSTFRNWWIYAQSDDLTRPKKSLFSLHMDKTWRRQPCRSCSSFEQPTGSASRGSKQTLEASHQHPIDYKMETWVRPSDNPVKHA